MCIQCIQCRITDETIKKQNTENLNSYQTMSKQKKR